LAGKKAKKQKPKKQKRSEIRDQTPEAYEFEVHPPGTLVLEELDLSAEVEDEERYEEEVKQLQEVLFREQIRLHLDRRRVIIVLEGWDAAGKGGAIRRLTARMDPRGYKVWPIAAPTEAERQHHYLWRFWQRAPARGELAIFDRSWYGRVLVERVEGFARPDEWQRAYDEINAFERMLTDDGIHMAKFFLHIDKKTQLERFREREKDPLKHYKIGPEDWRNRARWKLYEQAIQDMLDRTHRPDAPWYLVPGNDKKYARLEILRRCAELLSQA
jgi:polyphosphate kinase 2 (PPK2 family)